MGPWVLGVSGFIGLRILQLDHVTHIGFGRFCLDFAVFRLVSIGLLGCLRVPRPPQLPSNIPQIPTIKGHKASIKGPLGGPGLGLKFKA